jgi:hypothetical protein
LQKLFNVRDPSKLRNLVLILPSRETVHSSWLLFVQPCGSIPFHVDSPFDPTNFEGLAVVPTKGKAASTTNMVSSISDSIGALEKMQSLAPDPKSQQKYRATLVWLDALLQAWRTWPARQSASPSSQPAAEEEPQR